MAMQIFVRLQTGKVINLEVEAEEHIIHIKRKVCNKTNFPVSMFRLGFGGKALEDWYTLSHYNIQKESTLNMANYRPQTIYIKLPNEKTITLEVETRALSAFEIGLKFFEKMNQYPILSTSKWSEASWFDLILIDIYGNKPREHDEQHPLYCLRLLNENEFRDNAYTAFGLIALRHHSTRISDIESREWETRKREELKKKYDELNIKQVESEQEHKNQMEALQNEKDNAVNAVNALQIKFDELNKKYMETEHIITDKVDEYKQEIEKMQKEKIDQNETIDILQKEMENIKYAKTETDKSYDNAQKGLLDLRKDNENLSSRIVQLQNEFNEMCQLTDDKSLLQKELAKYKIHYKIIEARRIQLEKQISSLETGVKKTRKDIKFMTEYISTSEEKDSSDTNTNDIIQKLMEMNDRFKSMETEMKITKEQGEQLILKQEIVLSNQQDIKNSLLALKEAVADIKQLSYKCQQLIRNNDKIHKAAAVESVREMLDEMKSAIPKDEPVLISQIDYYSNYLGDKYPLVATNVSLYQGLLAFLAMIELNECSAMDIVVRYGIIVGLLIYISIIGYMQRTENNKLQFVKKFYMNWIALLLLMGLTTLLPWTCIIKEDIVEYVFIGLIIFICIVLITCNCMVSLRKSFGNDDIWISDMVGTVGDTSISMNYPEEIVKTAPIQRIIFDGMKIIEKEDNNHQTDEKEKNDDNNLKIIHFKSGEYCNRVSIFVELDQFSDDVLKIVGLEMFTNFNNNYVIGTFNNNNIYKSRVFINPPLKQYALCRLIYNVNTVTNDVVGIALHFSKLQGNVDYYDGNAEENENSIHQYITLNQIETKKDETKEEEEVEEEPTEQTQ